MRIKNMKLSQAGEFGLLKRLETRLVRQSPAGKGLVVDIGDDAFAAVLPAGKLLVATKDMLVENIHFRRRWIGPAELGYKAMAVNISDLAAMGGAAPTHALVGLALPGDISVDFVDKLYIGFNKACSKYGFRISGGDTVSSSKDIVISITLLGEIGRNRLITRSGARPGDLVFTTGCFGDSGAGLYLLEKPSKAVHSYEKKLVDKHLRPLPRLEAAQRLSATGYVTSMIDSSDGLAASLGFICEKSRAGISVDTEKISVSKELLELSFKDRKVSPLRLALAGGEDYELVFTAKPAGLERVKKAAGDITCIGVVTETKGVKYMTNGTAVKLGFKGYQAFS